MDGSTLGAAIALIKKNKPTDEQIESAVSDWLDDHPEATTTVQDGSITKAKLDNNLQGTVDDVSNLKNAFDEYSGNVASNYTIATGQYIATNGNLTALTASETQRTIIVRGQPNTRYHVKKSTATIMRVGIGSAGDLATGTHLLEYSGHSSASVDELIVTTDSTNVYIYIQLYASSDNSALRSIDANTASLIVYETIVIDDVAPSEFEVYSSQKTEQVIGEKIADGISTLIGLTHGKNLLDPSVKIANTRMYAVNTIGNSILTTSQNNTNVWKIPVKSGEVYTISHVNSYVIGDANDKALITTVTIGNYNDSTVTVPTNATLLWVEATNDQLSALAQVEKNSERTYYEPYVKYSSVQMGGKDIVKVADIPNFIPNMEMPTIVNSSMTKAEFIVAFNSALDSYAELNEAHRHSFLTIPTLANGRENELSWDDVFFCVNADMREDVATSSMSMEAICEHINKAFTKKINRFSDARLSDGNRKFSLPCNFQADEPSAIVVNDRLYVYAHLMRVYTEDGVTWSQPESLTLDGSYILHIGINYIDGVYYMIGTDKNEYGDLLLYTSTDGVNFTYNGVLFKNEIEFVDGTPVKNFGNPYLIKEYGSGKFYLYIEAQSDGASWVIYLTIFDNFTTQNQDGTIGSYTIPDNNPVLEKPLSQYRRASTGATSGAISAGNPDFAKGVDNRPIKYNGKYYMYFHSTWSAYTSLLRASSEDLVNWTVDGVLFDNRDIPSKGESAAGNADQCIIEFKGRTYLFYSWDINDPNHLPYIKYTIDDRPLNQILALRP